MQQILTIETSATQRYVLNNTLEAAGFAVIGAESADVAEAALTSRLHDEGAALEGVVLSWPDAPNDAMQRVMALLELPDHHDLPVMVLSQAKRSGARAWVDGRARARLMDWRQQRYVGEALRRLLGSDTVAVAEQAANDDGLSVLVVDDSPSIRLAFGDLLRLQGYRVDVVSSAREALEAVSSSTFDIAVVDFYLGEQTGDVLIRKLISASHGQLACAVLTSNYADHIIQQSLSAGAVACLFKSEPGDLLLARLEGIGRLVSEQSRLRARLASLDALVHAVPATWLHVDKHAGLIDLSTAARRHLALDVDRMPPTGTRIDSVHPDLAGNTGKALSDAVAAGEPTDVGAWGCRPLADGGAVIVRHDAGQVGGLQAETGLQFSVLLLACEFALSSGASASVAANPSLVSVLTQRLQQRVIQADRLAYLGHGLYTVVIAHRTAASGIVAARQLMLTVMGIGHHLGAVDLYSFGALVPANGPNARDLDLINRARDGARKAREQGRNHLYIATSGVVLRADPRAAD
ncbi:MAG: response regulator [Pseudomonadota bacterium]